MSARWQFIAIVVLGVAFLVCFRETGPSNYQIGVLMRCMILMIVAIGLNILIGHAGLVSLGQAALYGLGSYVAAWLAVRLGLQFIPRWRRRGGDCADGARARLSDGARARGLSRRHHHRVRPRVREHPGEWLSVTGGTQGLIGIPRGNVFGIR
jgi:ABC-type branched-subunit amino acid transport system permease subunit